MQKYTTISRCSGKKSMNRFLPKTSIFFLFVSLMITCTTTSIPVFSKTPMYVPSTPKGTTFGYVGISYDYVIVTMNQESFWMFDWGDGTNSSWLQLERDSTSISQTHVWDTAGTYQLHVKFKSDTVPYGIWSAPMFIEIITYTPEDFPHSPILYTGKIQGVINKTYTYSALSADPHDHPLRYRFDFGNGIISEWTEYVPSNSSGYLLFTWNKPGIYSLRIQAINQYGLESDWSDPVQVIMKNTSEDDGGSIDLIMVNNVQCQILYTSAHNGTFYNPLSGASTDIHWKDDGMFLIDDDGDGRWELFYIPALGLVQTYLGQTHPQNNVSLEIPWLIIIIILSIIFCVIGGIFILIKMGYIYFYEEETSVEE